MLKRKIFLKTNTLDNLELLFDNSNFENNKINKSSLSEYLSSNYPYFKYIKNSFGLEKLNQIIEIINYEVYEKNQIIIKYGEEVNKFYILLNGLIEIYKTKSKVVYLTLREYIDYLLKVKNIEKNNPKLERIKKKKKNFDYRYFQEKKKLKIYLEEDIKIAEFDKNFTFGDISIIKKEPIEQTIISLKKSIFITINKIDYNRFLREIEEKKINEKVNKFKKEYPFFSLWPQYKCYKLFNSFEKLILYKDDYLFKQNSKPDGIYFIKKGKLEIINFINFSWLENFIDYIHDSSFCILNDIVKVKIIPNNILRKYINDNIIKNENLNFTFKDKNKNLEFENFEIFDNSNLEKYSFKSIIKTISSPELLGYEECFEFKQRYYSVKCISEKAEIYKISIDDFFLLLPYDKKCEIFIKNNLLEKKMYLISQIKNNALKRVNFIDEDIRQNLLRLIKEDEIILNKKIKLKNNNYKNNKILYKSESSKNYNKTKFKNFKNTMRQTSQFYHLKSNLSFNNNKNFFFPIKKNNVSYIENLLSKDNLNLKGKLLRNNSQTIKLVFKSKNLLNKSNSLPKLMTLDDKKRMIINPNYRYEIPVHNLSLINQSHLMRNHYFDFNKNKREFKSNFI